MRQPLDEQDYEQTAKFLATLAYKRRPELLIPEETTSDESTGTERSTGH